MTSQNRWLALTFVVASGAVSACGDKPGGLGAGGTIQDRASSATGSVLRAVTVPTTGG